MLLLFVRPILKLHSLALVKFAHATKIDQKGGLKRRDPHHDKNKVFSNHMAQVQNCDDCNTSTWFTLLNDDWLFHHL